MFAASQGSANCDWLSCREIEDCAAALRDLESGDHGRVPASGKSGEASIGDALHPDTQWKKGRNFQQSGACDDARPNAGIWIPILEAQCRFFAVFP